MNLPFFLSRKLSLSSEKGKSTPAIKVAIIAVALSVGVMLASIAVVSGFKREITDKISGFNSHLTISVIPMAEEESNVLTLTPTLRKILDEKDYITDYSVQAAMPAVLKTDSDFKGVYIKGLDSESLRSFLAENLEEGEMPDFSDKGYEKKVIISRVASDQLGLKPGDKIDTYFMSDDLRVRKLDVAGVFNSHFDAYDNLYIYGALPLIQSLGGLNSSQGVSLTVTTDDFSRIEEYAADLQKTLIYALTQGEVYKQYRVDSAKSQGQAYFRWLDMLDLNVVVVLVLMAFVACMTLISGMLILILDKKKFIGVMKSMGLVNKKLRKVFVYLAIRVGAIGLLIGNIVMTAILFLQDKYHFIPLNPDSYYIDFVPVDLKWSSVVILNVAMIIVIYMALIIPARTVSRISPAETVKEEEN